MKKMLLATSCVLAALLLTSCAAAPPRNPENICAIFNEHKSWHKSVEKSREKWGVPAHVTMAMMYQESSFKHDAQPPMRYFLFIPYGRASDAYGYAQAKKATCLYSGHNLSSAFYLFQ